MRRVCYRLRGRSPFQARGANWVKKATVALESGVNARAEKLDTAREIIGNSVNGIGISDLPIIHSGFTLEHINTIVCYLCGLQFSQGGFVSLRRRRKTSIRGNLLRL